MATPFLSFVSPSSVTADNNLHTIQLFGSNFQSGDTLTFLPAHGSAIGSSSSRLFFVNSGEIDYQLNDAGDAGTWNVQVNSPDGTQHSGFASFAVASAAVTP